MPRRWHRSRSQVREGIERGRAHAARRPVVQEDAMHESGRTDELKGRVKVAAGALADDPELRREGRADQAEGKLKRKAGDWIDRLRDWLGGRSHRPR
jgi:uncharacterized protein YjbJ (UPF0337 family)